MIFFTTFLISMFVTIVLTPLFRNLAVRMNALDIPDTRKVHPYPIPKAGGIAMALGALVPIFLWAPGGQLLRAIMIGAGIVVLFGILDDFKNLGYKAKFFGQIIAALVVIFYGGLKIEFLGMLMPDDVCVPSWAAIPLTLVVIVGVTNAINLADGLDGLAGGISLLTFICIGYLAYRSDNIAIALLSVSIVGAIFGFLRFNTYPATLFMGDAGSQLLGFLAISLSLGLTQGNTPLSQVLPLILLGFPVLDTITVMLERVREGRSPFVADKNHFHHKLIRLGLFHTEAVFVIYFLQALLVTSAFIFRFYTEGFLLVLYIVFSGVILLAFYIAEKGRWQLERPGLMDRLVKGRLKVLKEKNYFIRGTFKIIEYGIPALLIFTCFLPRSFPDYVSYMVLGLLIIIVIAWVLKKTWLGGALRLCLYLLIPYLVYFSGADITAWVGDRAELFYNLAFGFFTVFVILTLKFTRRKKGFKTTPMDFLIIFIALVVPNLPDEQLRSYHMGLIAAKIIVFFFSYEVIIGELRGEFKKLGIATIAALVIVGVRAFI